MNIPFNKPYMTGKELLYITEAHANGCLAGNGYFTKRCHVWLENQTGCCKALLTHSCTAALEMAAILAGVCSGDEVIMPSYTFVSTANAVVLRGGVPVFIDIRPDTLNIDEAKIETAITHKTKAIVPVHYAGVSCEMDTIMGIAGQHHLMVIEDAAQALMSTYKGKTLGSIGHLAAVSFHETKNIISGEGGALLINDPKMMDRAEIIWEKGTDRKIFFSGKIDKYTWVNIGSSYPPSELIAAFLYAQFEHAEKIVQKRCEIHRYYHEKLMPLAETGKIRLPGAENSTSYNGHIFYILAKSIKERNSLINHLKECGVSAVFHYIPLHSSPAGIKFCRTATKMTVTDDISNRLIRLPLYYEMTEKDVDFVVSKIEKFYYKNRHEVQCVV